MAIKWTWVGAQTDEGFRVTASVTSGTSCRLKVSTATGLTSPKYSPAVTVDAQGYAKMTVTGLDPNIRYHYAIEVDGLDDPWRGRCRTFPTDGALASFKFGFSSCSETASNHPVWTRIGSRDLLLFIHLGDFGYWDILTNDQDAFRSGYEACMSKPSRVNMMKDIAVDYVYDNHDFGAPNGSGADPSRPAAANVFRQIVPSYALPAGSGDNPVYHDFRIGRVPIIITDLRWARSVQTSTDGPTKTMMGATQKAWFKQRLLDYKAAEVPVIFWGSSSVWHRPDGAGWGTFATERDELAEWIETNDIPPIAILSGDAHQTAYDKGTKFTPSGRGIPEHTCSPIDQNLSSITLDNHRSWTTQVWGYPYTGDNGYMYGVVEVTDNGDSDCWWNVTTWRAKHATFWPDEHLYSVDSRKPTEAITLKEAIGRDANGKPIPVKVDGAPRPVYVRP